MTNLDVWAPRWLSVLRIVSALLFMAHGTQKVLNFPEGPYYVGWDFASLIGWAGVLELFGGALLALGLFTRPVAFVLSGMMAVAYFIAHAGQGFFPILNGGELAALYSFLFLYFVFAGPGAWSLDGVIRARTAPSRAAEA